MSKKIQKDSYNIEFFHMHSDEAIESFSKKSIDRLMYMKHVLKKPHSKIILIDDYNATEKLVGHEKIISYLGAIGLKPDFWAYESQLIDNAELLLDEVHSKKLSKKYNRYIDNKGKYPCSLLTAAWYVTRLGMLPTYPIKGGEYKPAKLLINILPDSYEDVEMRAFELIEHSNFSEALGFIQDVFYEDDSVKTLDVF